VFRDRNARHRPFRSLRHESDKSPKGALAAFRTKIMRPNKGRPFLAREQKIAKGLPVANCG
jgi:hypothetical protein